MTSCGEESLHLQLSGQFINKGLSLMRGLFMGIPAHTEGIVGWSCLFTCLFCVEERRPGKEKKAPLHRF